MTAVTAALTVLGYLEQPYEEDVPDPLIWHNTKALSEHWDAVRQRRKLGQAPSEPMEEVPMEQNELTAKYH